MTYTEIITLLSRELLDKRAWPNDSSKIDEQLDLLYAAAISVSVELPLNRFTLTSKTLTAEDDAAIPVTFPLPDDIFSYREELGIQQITFDGRIFYPYQSSDYERVQMMSENDLYKYQLGFTIDVNSNNIHTNGLLDVVLKYLPLFTKPVNDSEDDAHYADMEFPLEDNDARRAIHIVAAHKSGVTIRDNAMAIFHDMLSKSYSTEKNLAQ